MNDACPVGGEALIVGKRLRADDGAERSELVIVPHRDDEIDVDLEAEAVAPGEIDETEVEDGIELPTVSRVANETQIRHFVTDIRSTEHQVNRMPRAIMGSGRSPLFNGSQNARNMPAAVHAEARRWLSGSCGVRYRHV